MIDTAYLYVAITVVCTAYGQMIVKWQTSKAGVFPGSNSERLDYLFGLITNPWMLTSLAATGVAAAAWIAALSHLELSKAYPFIAASFIIVLVLSGIFFDESITAVKLLGAFLIVAGLVLGSRG